MSPEDAARELQRMQRELEKNARDAVEQAADWALFTAHKLSSGTLTPGDLRRLGDPFALSHQGAPELDPAVINQRTGAFDRAWRVIQPEASEGGEITASVLNDSPEAAFLDQEASPPTNQRRMMRRPIKDQVAAVTEPVFQHRAASAVERALKP